MYSMLHAYSSLDCSLVCVWYLKEWHGLEVYQYITKGQADSQFARMQNM